MKYYVITTRCPIDAELIPVLFTDRREAYRYLRQEVERTNEYIRAFEKNDFQVWNFDHRPNAIGAELDIYTFRAPFEQATILELLRKLAHHVQVHNTCKGIAEARLEVARHTDMVSITTELRGKAFADRKYGITQGTVDAGKGKTDE